MGWRWATRARRRNRPRSRNEPTKDLPTFVIRVDKTSIGANIEALSQFAGEEDHVYPPLTLMELDRAGAAARWQGSYHKPQNHRQLAQHDGGGCGARAPPLSGKTGARDAVELEELGAPARRPHTAPRPAGGGRVAVAEQLVADVDGDVEGLAAAGLALGLPPGCKDI